MAATKLIKIDDYEWFDDLTVVELYLCETYQGRWYSLRYKGIDSELFNDHTYLFELDEFANFKIMLTEADIRIAYKIVETVKDRDYDEWIK